MQTLVAAIERATEELRLAPADGLAQARARGALARARESWPELHPDARRLVTVPAQALRDLLASVPAPLGPPPQPEVQLALAAPSPPRAAAVALSSAPVPAPEELLARMGLREFRPGQREAVAAALAGRDSLVVMPTGGGKSLCYQLPALAQRGLVVVVSPLIALMADQLRRLDEAGIAAVMLASGMPEDHNRRALADIRSGLAQLVLAAPERFASVAFGAALRERHVALFVVDEAHCVAEWGHDFRPDYLRLHHAIAELGRPAVMAATATATPRVAQEIAQRLQLRDPELVRSGFDRPNLSFDVVTFEGKGAVARKREALLRALRAPDGVPAIVYCGTRRDTEEVCAFLCAQRIAAVPYHAGMAPGPRRASQTAFMDGSARVVVATSAFGMGVDKADVRLVAHWAIPTSLEAYYQEAGRAGRDGAASRAVLLAARMDLGRLIRFNIERALSVSDVQRYVDRLRRGARGGVLECAPPADDERVLLSIAERSHALALEPAGGGQIRITLTGQLDAGAAHRAIKAARDRGWEAYRAIERFMTSDSCRRAQMLAHFGDDDRGAPTGRCCDVCDPLPADHVGGGLLGPAALDPAGPIRARRGGSAGGAQPAAAGDEPQAGVDEHDFVRLKAWRLSRAEGKPAFTVASDAALRAVLLRRPGDEASLLAIRGIGPAFCSKHGESLLEELTRLSAGGAIGTA